MTMTIERAIYIAELWRGGKAIGGDEGEVRDALLGELLRLRTVKKYVVVFAETWDDVTGQKAPTYLCDIGPQALETTRWIDDAFAFQTLSAVEMVAVLVGGEVEMIDP